MDILLLLFLSSIILLYKIINLKNAYNKMVGQKLEKNYLKLIAVRRKGFKDIYLGSYLLGVLFIGSLFRFFEKGHYENLLVQWILIFITLSTISIYAKITKTMLNNLNNIEKTFESVDNNLYTRLIETDKFLNTFKKLRKEQFVYFKLTKKKYKKSKHAIKILKANFDCIWDNKFDLAIVNEDTEKLNTLSSTVYDLYKHLKYVNRISEIPLSESELNENLNSLQNILIEIENLFKKGNDHEIL